MKSSPPYTPRLRVYTIAILSAVLFAAVLETNLGRSGPLLVKDDASGTYELFLPGIFGGLAHLHIPAGTFTMGCDIPHNGAFACEVDELPLHTVFLSDYLIDKTEVTNGEYGECVADGACTPPAEISSATRPSYFDNPAYDDYPVVWVDWYQAEAFCAWAGGRLPTEAEWEKAARGAVDTRAFPWGDQAPMCNLLNGRVMGQSCVGDTTPVGTYSPIGDSPFGMQDAAGNVYEWVADWYSASYYQTSPEIDPQGPETGDNKIRRSGAFGSFEVFQRVASRILTPPDTVKSYIGFRCAYDP